MVMMFVRCSFTARKGLKYFDLLNHRSSTFVLKTVSSKNCHKSTSKKIMCLVDVNDDDDGCIGRQWRLWSQSKGQTPGVVSASKLQGSDRKNFDKYPPNALQILIIWKN